MMQARRLGRSGIEVGPLGVGTWAIGGPFAAGEQPLGYGKVDDAESERAIRRAVELGVTFFDTADVYGTGHAERVLGRALSGRRDAVVLATKWGNTYDEATRQLTGADPTPEYARKALHRSLERLGTDHVDVWQLHLSDLEPALAEDLVAVCEDLVAEGLVRTYGWSTDDPIRAAVFARGPHCGLVQHELSVLHDAPELLGLCDIYDLASVNRSPLAMGLLTAKVSADTRPPADDIRSRQPDWLRWFADGRPSPEWLARRDAVRDVLTAGGRSLAQGAIGWIWARAARTVPIVGSRTVAQVEENAGALDHGPLTQDQLTEIDRILDRR
jgi:aryl-alcohol dehydrogenase-like predicted oxidoreductase